MTVMNRDSRKVHDLLLSICNKHNVVPDMDADELYALESIMLKFISAPVINLLKTRIKQVRKFEAKHGTMAYWSPVIMNMLRNSGSASRTTVEVGLPVMAAPQIYWYINNQYLLTDYSYDDLVSMMKICNLYSMDEVIYACGVGKINKVYEVRYISAVLEKERAKKSVVISNINTIAQKASDSNRLLNESIHQHNPLDMARVEYSWKETSENAEIQRRFEQFIRGDR